MKDPFSSQNWGQSSKVKAIFGGWAQFVAARASLVCAAFFLLTVGLAIYAASHLGIDTSNERLLIPGPEYLEARERYRDAFPHSGKELLIVVESATPETTRDAAAELFDRLNEMPEIFRTLEWPGESQFLRENRLLYLVLDEIEDITNRLARAQPFLARLAGDTSLPRLFGTLELALDPDLAEADIELDPILYQLEQSLTMARTGQPHLLSWTEVMAGESSGPDLRRQFLIAYPDMDNRQWLSAAAAVETIREVEKELQLAERFGATVRLTGSVALAYDERLTIVNDGRSVAVMAMVMVAIVLALGLRSGRLILASLITLIVGLCCTAAFAAATVGSLNMISVAFAGLYIGLGIDYAIHYCLRFRKNLDDGCTRDEALGQTSIMLGPTLLVCAISTMIGFYCFIPTAYRGLSELGLIAGSGMLISLVLSLSLLPALIKLLGFRRASGNASKIGLNWIRPLASAPDHFRTPYRLLAILLTVLGLLALPLVTFDSNPLNLRSPHSEAVITLNEIDDDPRVNLRSVNVLAEDKEQAADLAARLQALGMVDKVVLADDLIPAQQDEKLAMLSDLSLILGLDTFGADNFSVQTRSEEQNSAALKQLLDTLQQVERSGAEENLAATIRDFLSYEESLAADEAKALWQQLEKGMLTTLPTAIGQLLESLQADLVTADSLPQELRAKWIGGQGERRLQIIPVEQAESGAGKSEFVEQIYSVTDRATGRPVSEHIAGEAISSSFRVAMVIALAAIAVVVYTATRQVIDTLRILGLLLLTALLTTAVTVPLGLDFNFANVIAIPLLLGLSVDTTIHLVDRWRKGGVSAASLLLTTTNRAVIVSALTTMCSFSNLAFADHRGMASMGLLLFAGTCLMLFINMQILPALLPSRAREIGNSKLSGSDNPTVN